MNGNRQLSRDQCEQRILSLPQAGSPSIIVRGTQEAPPTPESAETEGFASPGVRNSVEGKGRDLGVEVRRMEGSEGAEGVWNEAGEIYGDSYLIVHTKAITG